MEIQLGETGWPRNYEVEILPGLSATGPEPVQLRETGHGVGRKGFVVRVNTASMSWIGNFQCGDGKLTAVYATPSPDYVCVVGRRERVLGFNFSSGRL